MISMPLRLLFLWLPLTLGLFADPVVDQLIARSWVGDPATLRSDLLVTTSVNGVEQNRITGKVYMDFKARSSRVALEGPYGGIYVRNGIRFASFTNGVKSYQEVLLEKGEKVVKTKESLEAFPVLGAYTNSHRLELLSQDGTTALLKAVPFSGNSLMNIKVRISDGRILEIKEILSDGTEGSVVVLQYARMDSSGNFHEVMTQNTLTRSLPSKSGAITSIKIKYDYLNIVLNPTLDPALFRIP